MYIVHCTLPSKNSLNVFLNFFFTFLPSEQKKIFKALLGTYRRPKKGLNQIKSNQINSTQLNSTQLKSTFQGIQLPRCGTRVNILNPIKSNQRFKGTQQPTTHLFDGSMYIVQS